MADKVNATEYKRKFNAQKYDRIEITVKKGKKEIIKAAAENQGKSVNGFINEAINEKIGRNEEKIGDNKI